MAEVTGPSPTSNASALTKDRRAWVGEHLGPIAKPDDIRYADNLPKTRSGKIMRLAATCHRTTQALRERLPS